MKRMLFIPVLSFFLLPTLFFLACEPEPEDVLTAQYAFTPQEVDCNMDSDVLENEREDDWTVKIEITDYCEGGGTNEQASEVEKIDDTGLAVKSVALEDEQTKVICWTVKPGEAVRVKCRGADGGCAYQLVVIQ